MKLYLLLTVVLFWHVTSRAETQNTSPMARKALTTHKVVFSQGTIP
jgi:hypothetical protein